MSRKMLLQLHMLMLLSSVTLSKKACDFTYPNDSVCSKVVCNAELNIKYVNESNQLSHKTIPVPCVDDTDSDVNVTGSCDSKINNTNVYMNLLNVSWSYDEFSYDLQFNFTKNEMWTLSGVAVNVTPINIITDLVSFGGNASTDFVGDLNFNRSYICNHSHSLDLTLFNHSLTPDYAISVTLWDFRMQAFEFDKEQFGRIARCTLDFKPPKLVAIVVGGSLGGLLVLIFILFTFGLIRERSRKPKYIKIRN